MNISSGTSMAGTTLPEKPFEMPEGVAVFFGNGGQICFIRVKATMTQAPWGPSRYEGANIFEVNHGNNVSIEGTLDWSVRDEILARAVIRRLTDEK